MLDTIAEHHLERIRNQTISKFTMNNLPQWVEKHTYINHRNYSFKDHEYQARILSDTSREVVIRKCSQIGMSEASSRFALALTAINPHYTVIYTLPTATFAADFMKTRIDPVIQSSPYLSEMIHKTTDNTEIKRFGDSYFYMKGCQSNNAPISVPADHLVHDEVDFSSEEVISKYHSRLTHSPYKRKTLLSTPTFPGRGIDAMFAESRRHFNMVKCNHCNFYFIPDYYEHVKIPGYKGDLRDITKNKLKDLNYHDAKTICPCCGKSPSLQIEHREYVCENPMDNYVAVGYQVSPFDAPNIHNSENQTLESFLIEASTNYKKRTDFVNFNLGLPAEDAESTVLASDLQNILVNSEIGNDGTYVFGLDMGMVCWLTVAKVLNDGRLMIEHVEGIPLTQVRKRRMELARKYWPRMTVGDNLPYTETILAMQLEDVNMFGAWYEEKKTLELYRVRDRQENKDKGEQELRQVNINRNKAFDSLLDDLRSGYIIKRSDDNDQLWMDHLTDMKRAKQADRDGEMNYVWKKSAKGEDHLHHSLLYAYIASKMMGVSHTSTIITSPVRSFRMKKTL